MVYVRINFNMTLYVFNFQRYKGINKGLVPINTKHVTPFVCGRWLNHSMEM